MERQVVVFLKENKLNPQIYLFFKHFNIIEFLVIIQMSRKF